MHSEVFCILSSSLDPCKMKQTFSKHLCTPDINIIGLWRKERSASTQFFVQRVVVKWILVEVIPYPANSIQWDVGTNLHSQGHVKWTLVEAISYPANREVSCSDTFHSQTHVKWTLVEAIPYPVNCVQRAVGANFHSQSHGQSGRVNSWFSESYVVRSNTGNSLSVDEE